MINGEVTVKNLKPGKYYVMTRALDHLFSEKKEVEVSDKEISITIELNPTGKVTSSSVEGRKQNLKSKNAIDGRYGNQMSR
ncbi:hypothetical protein KAS42_03715 [bacterium]|nr:hypothetical protein [bacterium]